MDYRANKLDVIIGGAMLSTCQIDKDSGNSSHTTKRVLPLTKEEDENKLTFYDFLPVVEDRFYRIALKHLGQLGHHCLWEL